MTNLDTNNSPSGKTVATTILTSFASALDRFDKFWHAGWYQPAHERACVARVAVDLTNKFGQTLEPWCEVSLDTLCKWKGLGKIPGLAKRGPVDLVLCDSPRKRIMALVEFKTHETIADDIEKLTVLRDILGGPSAIIVACQGIRLKFDKDSAVGKLDHFIQASLKEAPDGWQAIIDQDRPYIDIRGLDGSVWVVRPFVMWQSD
jgi:hypothetical protein